MLYYLLCPLLPVTALLFVVPYILSLPSKENIISAEYTKSKGKFEIRA